MDDIQQLKSQLAEAQAARKMAWEQGNYARLAELMQAEHLAESALSLAQGKETAVIIDWEPAWDVGAPVPHVLASGIGAYLLYLTSEESQAVALVTFERLMSFKFGTPNDEVLEGHPLYGRGLAAYAAHEIKNSQWVAELSAINAGHAGYQPEFWTTLKHYLLSFHDETFECVAHSHTIEILPLSLREAVQEVTERMNDAYWGEWAARRMENIRNGKSKTIPWETVKRDLGL